MGTPTHNYVFKALESYPYDLEEVMEALNYALSLMTRKIPWL